MANPWKFLLHNPLPTPLEDHLFYAVSPRTPLDEVIVRFLPQHQTKVDAVIHFGQMVQQVSTPHTPDAPITTTPRTLLNKLAPTLDPHGARHQEELDKLFRLKFLMAFALTSQPVPKPSFIPRVPITSQMNAFPSKHNLHWWLRALAQLFQNTAWDRWRYQIGVQWAWQDPVNLAPCLAKQNTH